MQRASTPVDTQYQVALDRMNRGEIQDAFDRFRMVLRFDKQHINAWYGLGTCAIELGDIDTVEEAYRHVLALNPQHEEARYLLAVNVPGLLPVDQEPKYIPLALATQHFDGLADFYDAEELDGLGYEGHTALAAAIKPHLQGRTNLRMVDLGCGTGLVGLQMQQVVEHIDGVDISQNMLDLAAMRRDTMEQKIYKALHCMDLRRFLLDQPAGSVDVVTAANVLPFVGGLTPVFDGAFQLLKPGGIFAFSVDPLEAGEFQLIPGEGRFGHSDAYIRAQAEREGFEVVEGTSIQLYSDATAMQYVLRKPAAGGA